MMHAATLSRSPRLQRVLAALREAGPDGMTTRDVMRRADVCAVSACVAELRVAGFQIECRQEPRGRRRLWRYRLLEDALAL